MYFSTAENCAAQIRGPPKAFCSCTPLRCCLLKVFQERKLAEISSQAWVLTPQGASTPALPVLGLVPQPRSPLATSLHLKGRGRRSRLVWQTPPDTPGQHKHRLWPLLLWAQEHLVAALQQLLQLWSEIHRPPSPGRSQ